MSAGLLEQTRASGRLADAVPDGGVAEVSAGKRSLVAAEAGGSLPAERDPARRVFNVGVCQALGWRPQISSVFGRFLALGRLNRIHRCSSAFGERNDGGGRLLQFVGP